MPRAYYKHSLDTSDEFLDPTTGEYVEVGFTLNFNMAPAEPDVGINAAFIDDYELVGLTDDQQAQLHGSSTCGLPDWLLTAAYESAAEDHAGWAEAAAEMRADR